MPGTGTRVTEQLLQVPWVDLLWDGPCGQQQGVLECRVSGSPKPAAPEPLGRPGLWVPASPPSVSDTPRSEALGCKGFRVMQQAGMWTAGHRCSMCNPGSRCHLCSPKRCSLRSRWLGTGSVKRDMVCRGEQAGGRCGDLQVCLLRSGSDGLHEQVVKLSIVETRCLWVHKV